MRIHSHRTSASPVVSWVALSGWVLLVGLATSLAPPAARAAPFAYITNCGSNDVSVIDTATNRVVATVPVGTCPYGVAVSPDGKTVYVTNSGSGNLSVIDATTNREQARIPVAAYPIGIAVDPGGKRIYVANSGADWVAFIDTSTFAVTGGVWLAWSNVTPTGGITVHPDGSRLYVTAARTGFVPPPPCGATGFPEPFGIAVPPPCGEIPGAVLVIDIAAQWIAKDISVRAVVSGITVNRAGTRVYAAGRYGTTVIDTGSDEAIGLLPWMSTAVAAHPAGTPLFAARNTGSESPPPEMADAVLAIDTVSDRVTATIPIYRPRGLAVNPEGSRLYVASGSKWVAAIDVATSLVLDWIEVGAGPVAFGHFIGPAAPGANYQGIWWAAPAGSESGWGLNLAHQADTIFASWFTYDLAGRGWWLVMTAQKSAMAAYAGTLYETRGPAFDAVPFDPSRVTATPVGTGTLTFNDTEHGTFAYAVRGVTQTKPITREVFGPQPVCTFGALPDLATATNYQDLWWAAPAKSESGWGINLNHQGDKIFATWFTYDLDGTPLWLVTTALKSGANAYRGDLYRTTGPPFNSVPFEPATVVATKVGTVTFTFADGNSATFAYTVQLAGMPSPAVQGKRITRQVFAAPGTMCR